MPDNALDPSGLTWFGSVLNPWMPWMGDVDKVRTLRDSPRHAAAYYPSYGVYCVCGMAEGEQ